MKSYQIHFENEEQFTGEIIKIKDEYAGKNHGDIVFYLSWIDDTTSVPTVSRILDDNFPNSFYYGNEAAGNISNGNLSYGISVTCHVFEKNDTRTKLIWVEEGTDYSSITDLWDFCRNEKGLRGVELIPSMSYLLYLRMDKNIPDISEDVLIFGGASVCYDNSNYDAHIYAKGHDITQEGLVAVLYYGDELNISADYVIGWKGLGRYMKVTESGDREIRKIDGMPAFSVYQKYLGLNQSDNDNLVFPLIVEEDGVEFIRTPQMFMEDNNIRMFANVDEGAMVRIAYGDKNTILRSLIKKAADVADFKPQVLKAYSCTARKMFWGDEDVCRETLPLQKIAPVNGFYTGGEILRFGNRLRVLNSTLVIIGFREGNGEDQDVVALDGLEDNDKSLISRITHFVQVVSDEQKRALDLANEEKRRNDILHSIIQSGKWSFFLNEKDEVISAEFSDEVRRLIDNDFENDAASWVNLFHPDDSDNVSKAFYATVNDHSGNTPYNVTCRMMNRNGEYHWFRSAGRILEEENGIREFFGIHIDITNQIEEQAKQAKKLENALKMADSANFAKTEFLFNMSHDIRTPMNAILGFTNMAIKHVDDTEKVIDCLTKAQQSEDLLLELINSVLEVSRIESGNAVVEEEKGDIYYCFEDIENTMAVMAESKNIGLTFEFGSINDRYVYYDFSRCARVFVNIISNAIKYTNEGGFVKVKCEQIPSQQDGYGSYKYTFEDNGIGMSEEFKEHVFDQFSREKSVTKTGIQGTGLGMAVCKSYVELMNGTIKCDSELGKGTTFTVILPFKLRNECALNDLDGCCAAESEAEVNRHKSIDFSGKRTLLTEDNELNREIAIDTLEDKGIIVEEADDGSVAVEMLREKGPDYYDFILMDIQMPIMDGYEATRKIREMYPDKHIPIVALSANAFDEDRKASIEAGMDAHVAKPIEPDVLFEALVHCM